MDVTDADRGIFFSTYKTGPSCGGDKVPLQSIGPHTSRLATVHTTYTRQCARHLFPVSLLFYGDDGRQLRVLDTLIGSVQRRRLHRLFPLADFYVTGSELRAYRPFNYDHRLEVAGGGTLAGGLGQSAVFAWKSAGIIKVTTETCIGVASGTAAVMALGTGVACLGLAVYSGFSKEIVYLFRATGPVADLPADHKDGLKRLYDWKIGHAAQVELKKPEDRNYWNRLTGR